MTDQRISIFIISDSAGETASKLAQASMAQYEDAKIKIQIIKRAFIYREEELVQALDEAKALDAIVLHTLVSKDLVHIANNYGKQQNLFMIDLLSGLVGELSKRTGLEPSRLPGAMHFLSKNYFERISAMEFAVKYDDGKNPKGFLEADILLLGVSRTSKTPLSLFLANKNLKVANLPLIPEAHIPPQLWEVDPKKIVGLTNNPKVLNRIRRERMKSYGLNPDTAYSDIDKIKRELDFANDLYKKLGCLVINVAQLSIEETASIILSELNIEDTSYFG
ncbi:pyruvate, water dikinase regulatory protein [Vagococcus luciliae]|uniref:Putative pyruvate, phosphate dikinase regulatory protein n=1 Tax=Vagococcus luciliae TaxID=2920380 RepID=A0ABY5P0C6_9ENTE|nr:pyruvate, water dikinase regulatory protein [Vagococcus luciliae]UUV99273.1 Putative pyruvate, phosphate dikinase regulatory protein [Vagococcus luciliae]